MLDQLIRGVWVEEGGGRIEFGGYWWIMEGPRRGWKRA